MHTKRWSVGSVQDYNISRAFLDSLCCSVTEAQLPLPQHVVSKSLRGAVETNNQAFVTLPEFDTSVYTRHINVSDVAMLVIRQVPN